MKKFEQEQTEETEMGWLFSPLSLLPPVKIGF